MGVLLLLVTTFIWGTAFLAQKSASADLGPVAVTVFRNILGGAFLLSAIFVRSRMRGGAFRATGGARTGRSVLAGIACGAPLFAAMSAQQIGIQYTTPGISAFLTTNYVLFVPVVGAVLMRRMPRLAVWAGAALAVAGTYFICLGGGAAAGGFAGVGRGELWTIACAFLFAVQMLVVERFAGRSDLLVMSATQLLTCSVLGAPLLFTEAESSRLAFAALKSAAIPLVYCGVFSSGIAYTLQNVAQSRVSAPVAGVMLSLESVFGALAGWVVLGDRLAPVQILGCCAVLAAAVIVQAVPAAKGENA